MEPFNGKSDKDVTHKKRNKNTPRFWFALNEPVFKRKHMLYTGNILHMCLCPQFLKLLRNKTFFFLVNDGASRVVITWRENGTMLGSLSKIFLTVFFLSIICAEYFKNCRFIQFETDSVSGILLWYDVIYRWGFTAGANWLLFPPEDPLHRIHPGTSGGGKDHHRHWASSSWSPQVWMHSGLSVV